MLSASCVVFIAARNPSAALSPPTFRMRSLKTGSNSTQWPSPSITGWSRRDRICAAVCWPSALMCSPPQGLRHSSPPSTGSQDDLLEPGESTSLKPVRSLTLALLLLSALGGCALPSARDVTLETSLREEIHTVRVAEAD